VHTTPFNKPLIFGTIISFMAVTGEACFTKFLRMRAAFTLAIFLVSILSTGFGQVYKSSAPLVYQGQVYDITVQLAPADTSGAKLVMVSFYLSGAEGVSYADFERSGSFSYVKKAFFVDANTKKSTGKNLLPDLSTAGENGLSGLTRCTLDSSGNEIKIALSNSIGSDKVEMNFSKPTSDLMPVDSKDVLPETYVDAEYLKIIRGGRGAAVGVKVGSTEMELQPNFIPRFAGDIDSKQFPQNLQLWRVLNYNRDFIFKTSMDLYLDIMRFKAIKYRYDKETVLNFLHLHDLRFFKYEQVDTLLNKKIKACVQLLSEAASKINLGDIYYKDFTIDTGRIDMSRKPFTLVPPDPQRDDYYASKRIKGEPDAHYTANALSLYLSNWVTMNDLAANRTPLDTLIAKAGGDVKHLTLRVYFLIQPIPAFGTDGTFKGVSAYGLKAVLFKDCPATPLAVIKNTSIDNIADPVVKRCYRSAVSYLEDSIRFVSFDEVINGTVISDGDFKELGQWYKPVSGCEVGYHLLSGRLKKHPGGNAVLTLKMMTNYTCTFQPGYEVTFLNRLTNASVSLPITDATTVQSREAVGYYIFTIPVDHQALAKMIAAKVNSISFQCVGQPKYKMALRYSLPFPNKVINQTPDIISAHFEVDKDGSAPKMVELLGK
jgi:hypothetical protein